MSMQFQASAWSKWAAQVAVLLLSLCWLPLQAAPLPLDPQLFSAPDGPRPDWERLQRLYALSDRPLLWYHDGVADQTRIDALAGATGQAEQQGLPAQRYRPLLVPVDNLPQRDLMLSEALLRLVDDLGDGILPPGEGDRLWKLPAPVLDPVAQAWEALQAPDLQARVLDLAPHSPQYQALVAQYRRLQLQQQSAPAEPSRLPEGLVLRPDQQAPEVPLLRQRLEWLGALSSDPLAQATAPDLYDQLLVAAVRRFQLQHGLDDDGVVGRKTLAELNRNLRDRLLQVATNLERWRWLPRELGSRYILVSTAGYVLNLVENGQVVMETRIISGRPRRPTPSFRSDLSQLTVNPTWTVPRRIMREDLVPKIRRDPTWLETHNMRVQRYEEGSWRSVTADQIDWSEPGSVRLKQAPGDQNSLGRLKFGMDNPYSIYLHDTPARKLFDKPVRPFSSGCIRVEGIAELVEYLLRDDSALLDWYNAAMAQGDTRVRTLPQRIPVYLVYLSTWVDVEGGVHFLPDIYGLDGALQVKLRQFDTGQAKSHQIAVN